jgi:transposase-like protein
VQIEVHHDMDASFQPTIVQKRQRRLTGVDQIVLSLSVGLDNRGDFGRRAASST